MGRKYRTSINNHKRVLHLDTNGVGKDFVENLHCHMNEDVLKKDNGFYTEVFVIDDYPQFLQFKFHKTNGAMCTVDSTEELRKLLDTCDKPVRRLFEEDGYFFGSMRTHKSIVLERLYELLYQYGRVHSRDPMNMIAADLNGYFRMLYLLLRKKQDGSKL